MMMEDEAKARAIARARGHRDLDHIIVCTDGTRVPVWIFYLDAVEDHAPVTSTEGNTP